MLDVKYSIMRVFQSGAYYLRSFFSLLLGFDQPLKLIRFFIFQQKAPFVITLKTTRLNFLVRNPMDIWSIKETFLDDFYKFYKSKKPENGVILDIGAGIGEFAIQAAVACPGCTVIGFEPYRESFDFFQKNIKKNSLTNVIPIDAAVSSLAGNLTMDVSSGNPLQFRTVADEQNSVSVETLQLIPYLDKEGITSVKILKMDCEGGEYDILLPLRTEDLHRFQFITMEYHDRITPHHHSELVSLLENAGFSVECVSNKVHSEIGYIYARQKGETTH